MATFFLVLHLFTCVVLVLVVLLQAGKDGGIGMMAASGSSQTVFGSSGGANFFTKFTSATAAVFMITSIVLTITKGGKRSSIFGSPTAATAPGPGTAAGVAVPAAPTGATGASGASGASGSTGSAPAKSR